MLNTYISIYISLLYIIIKKKVLISNPKLLLLSYKATLVWRKVPCRRKLHAAAFKTPHVKDIWRHMRFSTLVRTPRRGSAWRHAGNNSPVNALSWLQNTLPVSEPGFHLWLFSCKSPLLSFLPFVWRKRTMGRKRKKSSLIHTQVSGSCIKRTCTVCVQGDCAIDILLLFKKKIKQVQPFLTCCISNSAHTQHFLYYFSLSLLN